MNEQWEYHRYQLHTHVTFEEIDSPALTRTTTKDISRGGICIQTEERPLPVGAHYLLKFKLPGVGEEIQAVARVAWQRQAGRSFDNGLNFTKIDERDLALIEEYSIGVCDERKT